MGDIKEPATILRRILAVALGDIEWHRRRSPVQLIFHLTDSHRALQERSQPGDECDRFSIDFKFLMIEPAFLRRAHGVLLLILILLFILFLLLIFLRILLFLQESWFVVASSPN